MVPIKEAFGRYLLIERLAVGGMGEVFLARYQTAAGVERLAVVKRILPHLTSDPDFVSYFLNEGRITSLLCHPNVVQTLELGRTGGQYYIAMEHVLGRTVVRLLATALARRRVFTIPLVMHIGAQIASALEYIHNLKNIEGRPLHIIHMDLAPHNIIASPDGSARLLDFGISRASGLANEPLRRDFRGRTAYMAPELLDGLPLDKRVDIFALGVILHEMILCRPLFRARTDQQTATRVLYAPVPGLRKERRDCPEQLERIVLKCLARERDERYSDAGQVLEDLDWCAGVNSIVRSTADIRAELQEMMSTAAESEGRERGEFEVRATSVER